MKVRTFGVGDGVVAVLAMALSSAMGSLLLAPRANAVGSYDNAKLAGKICAFRTRTHGS